MPIYHHFTITPRIINNSRAGSDRLIITHFAISSQGDA